MKKLFLLLALVISTQTLAFQVVVDFKDKAAASQWMSWYLDGAGNGAPSRIEVNVRELMTSHDPVSNVPIEPGDIISVPIDRELYIYVDGAVKTPGRIEQLSSRPITLLQAIAKAGGMTDRANLKGVQILRQSDNGTQQIATINIKHVRKGKATDPLLQDGDIIVVPETFF